MSRVRPTLRCAGICAVACAVVGLNAYGSDTPADPAALFNDAVRLFFAARPVESADAFDRLVAARPESEPELWQRGLALYYADRFDDGRRQFEVHRSVNPADVENVAWHFACVARDRGPDAARGGIIPVGADARVPMREVLELFAGRAEPAAVLAAAEAGPAEARRNQRCFAHLYLGLYFEAIGADDQARRHMLQAAGPFAMDHFMGRVAQLHCRLRGWTEVADVTVAPAGNDQHDGSATAPVATLRRALDRVRELRAAEPDRPGPFVVEVADGRYELAATLLITPEDSGTAGSPTVIRAADGARPLFSGGRIITGWTVSQESPQEQPRWTAVLPEVKAGAWNFSQLFVNDQRRFRPVLPATGWYTIADALPPSPANADKGHDRFVFSGDDLRTDWANLGDVEVVAVHRWTMTRLPIAAIDPVTPVDPLEDDAAQKAVTFAGHTQGTADWCSFPKGNRFLVENVREALGLPGSWYLDRPTGTLTYCPQPGETPEAVTVVAPVLDRLVELRGEVAARKFVAHVRLEGLSFAHGNWNLPTGGQSYPQAEVNVGAAIGATAARHIAFDRCSVRHVGRYAFELGHGCQECTLSRCELVDLAAGGVLVGTTAALPDPEAAVTGNVVRDCTIAHGGRIHSAAIGIWIGHASHTTVAHCDIFDLTYSGVSIGWSWGYAESPAHHNRVLHNHMYDIGHGVLSDMGGVYTLGVSPGTVVEGNLIHDIQSHNYGGWGLYTDEGSTGIELRNNIVYRTSSGGFHQHYGRDNIVENNIFAVARDWQLQRSRVEDHPSFRFERNIVWWNSDKPLVNGDWSKGLVTAANCYWNAAGPVVFPGGQDLAARQAAGQDERSIVADPKFLDPRFLDPNFPDPNFPNPSSGTFAIAPDSPALALGFEPIDASLAGRRTPRWLAIGMPDVPTLWPESRQRKKPAP